MDGPCRVLWNAHADLVEVADLFLGLGIAGGSGSFIPVGSKFFVLLDATTGKVGCSQLNLLLNGSGFRCVLGQRDIRLCSLHQRGIEKRNEHAKQSNDAHVSDVRLKNTLHGFPRSVEETLTCWSGKFSRRR